MQALLDNPSENEVRFILQTNTNRPFISESFIVLLQDGNYNTAKMMLDNGFDINTLNVNELTPLEALVRHLNINAVKFILQYRPDLTTTNYDGNCCLVLAFIHAVDQDAIDRGKAIAQLLIEAGSDINFVNRDRENILQTLTYDGYELSQNVALLEQALRFFIDRGLNPATLLENAHITRMTNAYLIMLTRFDVVMNSEQKNRLFLETWRKRNLEKYLIFNYRLTVIDNDILEFILDKLLLYSYMCGFSGMMEYLDLLIEANCIRFIPDINLYPPNKQEKVITFTNSRAYSKFPFLPNELLFKIFSEM